MRVTFALSNPFQTTDFSLHPALLKSLPFLKLKMSVHEKNLHLFTST
jgi:hypothetical protein